MEWARVESRVLAVAAPDRGKMVAVNGPWHSEEGTRLKNNGKMVQADHLMECHACSERMEGRKERTGY